MDESTAQLFEFDATSCAVNSVDYRVLGLHFRIRPSGRPECADDVTVFPATTEKFSETLTYMLRQFRFESIQYYAGVLGLDDFLRADPQARGIAFMDVNFASVVMTHHTLHVAICGPHTWETFEKKLQCFPLDLGRPPESCVEQDLDLGESRLFLLFFMVRFREILLRAFDPLSLAARRANNAFVVDCGNVFGDYGILRKFEKLIETKLQTPDHVVGIGHDDCIGKKFSADPEQKPSQV